MALHKQQHNQTQRPHQPDAFHEVVGRVFASTPAWLASAAAHGLIFLLMLHVTVYTTIDRKPDPVNVSLVEQESQTELDSGRDVHDIPIPVPAPTIEPSAFTFHDDFDLDANVLAEQDIPKLAVEYGSFGARSAAGRQQAVESGGGASGRSERAVELALEWLSRHQSPNGAWEAANYRKHCYPAAPCPELGREPVRNIDPGLTGLSTLAYLGAGYTDTSGRFQQTVKSALKYLISIQAPDGGFGPKIGTHFIYNHLICTLAMTEACGMTHNLRYRASAERGLDFMIRNQYTDGGWGYVRDLPNQANMHVSDTSVTGWAAMALKSAQMAKLEVSEQVWRSALHFVGRTSDEQGLAGYVAPGHVLTPGNPSTYAVGLLAQQFSPFDVDARQAAKITDVLAGNLPLRDTEGFFYYAYHGSLVLYQYGGPKWEKWNRHVRTLLVENQEQTGCEAGSWDPGERRWASWAGRVYSTAMAALTLEVYYRYLPIHRGYLNETPLAAELQCFAKSAQAYRFFIELSEDGAEPDKTAQAAREALELLERYRQTALSMEADDAGNAERRSRRLAATAIRIATIAMRTGDYARCVEQTADFEKRFPGYADRKTPAELRDAALAMLAVRLEGEGHAEHAGTIRQALIDDEYRKIVSDSSQPPEMYVRVADAYYARKDWRRAGFLIAEMLKRFPSDPLVQQHRQTLRLRLAHCKMEERDYTAAIEIYEMLRGESGPTRVLLESLAECYTRAGRFDDALDLYFELRNSAAAGSSDWWKAQHGIAESLMLLGRNSECDQLIRLLQATHPSMGGSKIRLKFDEILRSCREIMQKTGATSR